MYSNCCGAEPSYLSDDKCGDCLENAVFEDHEEDEEIEEFELTNEEQDRYNIWYSTLPYTNCQQTADDNHIMMIAKIISERTTKSIN